MSKLYVDQVDPKTATTLTLGTSGDTITVPSGAELKSNKISPASGTAFTFGDSGDTFTFPREQLLPITDHHQVLEWMEHHLGMLQMKLALR